MLLKVYGSEEPKPFVYSCDDWVESILDQHYDSIKDLFFFFDGGQSGIITKYMDKDAISQLSIECGCKVPKSVTVNRGELPKGLRYPVITKSIMSVQGGWKGDCRICYSEEQLKEEYKTIKSEKLLVEEFIEKENELCLDGFSFNHGKDVIIPFQTTYLRVAPGKYGNYMKLEPFTNEKVYNQVKRILKRSGFNGIFSVEFLLDKNNELYFLEVNFRNSTWSYAFTYGGVNMPYEWAKATLTGKFDDSSCNIRKKPFTAIVANNDFKDFVKTGEIGKAKWLYQLLTTDCYYYFNRRDLKPFIFAIKRKIKNFIKHNK